VFIRTGEASESATSRSLARMLRRPLAVRSFAGSLRKTNRMVFNGGWNSPAERRSATRRGGAARCRSTKEAAGDYLKRRTKTPRNAATTRGRVETAASAR